MTTEHVCALDVNSVAADDCVLLFWTTWPMILEDAPRVLKAWNFDYITGLPWIKVQKSEQDLWGEWHHKTQMGVGYWVRGVSEPLLICRRGKPKLPRETFVGLLSPNIAHSRKPDSIYELAESMEGPYLEMFARRARPGWHLFGNEVKSDVELVK